MQKPIPIFRPLRDTYPYRPFTWGWCRGVLSYPVSVYRDLYTVYHRARYGWAPRDVWNLDIYLDRVLSDTLTHLADTTHGTPSGYPHKKHPPLDEYENPITDHEQWVADLKRWSAVFDECYRRHETEWDVASSTGWLHRESHSERRARVLTEMGFWWDGLWD